MKHSLRHSVSQALKGVQTMYPNVLVFPSPTAKLPTKGTEFAAGYDIFADLLEHGSPEIWLPAEGGRFAVPTGLKFAIPAGYHFKVEARSGTAAKNGITCLCGVIDEDYRGELKVVLVNTGREPFQITHGQKIAQLILVKTEQCAFSIVGSEKELGDTQRGTGGFGSTGA